MGSVFRITQKPNVLLGFAAVAQLAERRFRKA